MEVIRTEYYKAIANYEDGTYIERFYTTFVSPDDIENELLHEFTKLFGECLDSRIESIDGALSRFPAKEVLKIYV